MSSVIMLLWWMISSLHGVDCLCCYEVPYMLVFSSWITFFFNSIFWAPQAAILNNTFYHLIYNSYIYNRNTQTYTHMYIHHSWITSSMYWASLLCRILCLYFSQSKCYHTWTHMLKSVRLTNYNCTPQTFEWQTGSRRSYKSDSYSSSCFSHPCILFHSHSCFVCLVYFQGLLFIWCFYGFLSIEKKSKRPYLPSRLSRYSFFFFLLSCADCLFRIFLRIFFRIFSSY